MKKLWTESAWADYQMLQETRPEYIRLVNAVIMDIEQHGVANAEPLAGLADYFSIKLDGDDCIVFALSPEEDTLIIQAVRNHL